MEVGDLALAQGDNPDPAKHRRLVERGNVLEVTGEPVEALGQDDVDLSRPHGGEQRLVAGAEHGGAGDGSVGEGPDDLPALAVGADRARGRTWYDITLRGRPTRGDGILRNPLYTGRLQWNRSHTVVDPVSGTEVWRPKAGEDWVETAVPHLRIVPDELWQAAQARLAAEAAPQPAVGHHLFWQRRRPQHMLTGKVVCGCCGSGFSVFGKDYLGCRTARNGGACRNATRVRRAVLEDRVLRALRTQLMRPDLVAEFCATFIEEWNRLAAEASAGAEAHQRELQAVERKIGNLVDAIADGLKAPGLQQKLAELEARRRDVQAALDAGPPIAPPALHPNLAQAYAEKVATLRHALEAEDGTEALEEARALIDTVVVSPPNDPGDPPGIELTGNLIAMLKAGGAALPPEDRTLASCLTTMLESSVQEDPRGRFSSPALHRASRSANAARNRAIQAPIASGLVFSAVRLTTRREVTFAITSPSRSPFAFSVEPVCTRSTISCASPMEGASSIAPFRCTISACTPRWAKWRRAMFGYLVATVTRDQRDGSSGTAATGSATLTRQRPMPRSSGA